MQSKAGMFLRIFGSLGIVYFVSRPLEIIHFLPSEETQKKEETIYVDYLKKRRARESKLNELYKKREEIYLFSSPNDIEAEQKIKQINEEVKQVAPDTNEIDRVYRQEKRELYNFSSSKKELREKLSFFIVFILILCLFCALIVPIEWISFGLIFVVLFFSYYKGMQIYLSPSIYRGTSIVIGFLLLLVFLSLMLRCHSCAACEVPQEKKRGFFCLKIYSFLSFFLMLFLANFFANVLDRIWDVNLSPTWSKTYVETGSGISAHRRALSDSDLRLITFNQEKQKIIELADITQEGQSSIMKIDQKIANEKKENALLKQQLNDSKTRLPVTKKRAELYHLVYIAFIIIASLLLSFLIPIQFLQYTFMLIGFFAIGGFYGIESSTLWHIRFLIFLLYILVVILLFKRQKHICGTL